MAILENMAFLFMCLRYFKPEVRLRLFFNKSWLEFLVFKVKFGLAVYQSLVRNVQRNVLPSPSLLLIVSLPS